VTRGRVADGGARGENPGVIAFALSVLQRALPLLAVLGACALGFRLLRALLRLGIAAAETTAVAGLVDISARRGDLTELAERQRQERSIRRTVKTSAAGVVVWLALLLVPAAAGLAREAFAAAAFVWLLPRRPLRLPSAPPQSP
jgi:hypothetical protein